MELKPALSGLKCDAQTSQMNIAFGIVLKSGAFAFGGFSTLRILFTVVQRNGPMLLIMSTGDTERMYSLTLEVFNPPTHTHTHIHSPLMHRM